MGEGFANLSLLVIKKKCIYIYIYIHLFLPFSMSPSLCMSFPFFVFVSLRLVFLCVSFFVLSLHFFLSLFLCLFERIKELRKFGTFYIAKNEEGWKKWEEKKEKKLISIDELRDGGGAICSVDCHWTFWSVIQILDSCLKVLVIQRSKSTCNSKEDKKEEKKWIRELKR